MKALEIDWPRCTPAQRACADAAIQIVDSSGRLGAPHVRVLSMRGGFVTLLTFDDGTRSVLKVSPDGDADEVSTEYSVLRRLGDEYAERVRAFIYAQRTAAIALQWVDAISLNARWEAAPADVKSRRDDLRVVATMLDDLHRHDVVHGDLQPTHIRFVAQHATVIDFGVSGSPGTSFGGGLIHYLAPEYATRMREGHRPLRTTDADWYALLASAFVAVTGEAPVIYPDGADRDARLAAIAAGNIRPDAWADPLAHDLAEALLLPPDQRRDWIYR